MKLARAALALVTGLIAELPEILALAPDARKRRFAYIAAIEFQIAAGLHLAGMADKTETRAAQTAAGHGVHAEGFRRDAQAFRMRALAHDPVVMRRAGGLQMHAGALAEIIEPVQHVLVFLSRDHLIREARGRPMGTSRKMCQAAAPMRSQRLENLLEAAEVVAGHCGVDLKGQAASLR